MSNRFHLVPALALGLALAACGRSTEPAVASQAAALAPDAIGGIKILTYKQRPTEADLDALRTKGITRGIVLQQLPMILVKADGAQLAGLSSLPGLRSVADDTPIEPMLHEGRVIAGVEAAREDARIRAALGNLPVSGKGVGIALLDTGVDTTHPDLVYGQNIAQTVLPLPALDPLRGCIYAATLREEQTPAFVPPQYVEGAPNTDVTETSGHGTLIAGVLAGSGKASGGLYRGVAPGAKVVALNVINACGTSIAGALMAFDWVLAHREAYALRVVSMSWGAPPIAAYASPDLPINVATRMAHDAGLLVVVAAGNLGDTDDAMNATSVWPWVLSIGSGRKNGDGALSSFSSRGVDDGANRDVAPVAGDSRELPNIRPDLIAPGEELFTTCERTHGCTAALPVAMVPLEHRPFYSPANGTSFATPFVAAVAALMLEANPALTPDQLARILLKTATPMPYTRREAGYGYLAARGAVLEALDTAD